MNKSPSDYLEQLAAEIVDRYISSYGGNCKWIPRNEPHDFRVEQAGSLIGLGEVKSDINQDLRKFHDALEKNRKFQSPGVGPWLIFVNPKANVKRVRDNADTLVQELTRLGLNRFLPNLSCSDTEQDLRDLALKFGVGQLQVIAGDEKGWIYLAEAPEVNLLIDKCPPVADWVTSMIDNSQNKAEVKTLAKSDVRQRHFFLFIHHNSPIELQLYSQNYDHGVPPDSPALPDWITHLWISSGYVFAGKRIIWLFTREHGWQSFPSA
jgi:hypothetical protein